MTAIIWLILRWLGVLGAVGFAVRNEAVATNGDFGIQQWFNIGTWVLGAAAAFFATSGNVIEKVKAAWAWIQRNPFPRLSSASKMRDTVLDTVAKFKHVPLAKREALLKAADDFCCCAALHEPDDGTLVHSDPRPTSP